MRVAVQQHVGAELAHQRQTPHGRDDGGGVPGLRGQRPAARVRHQFLQLGLLDRTVIDEPEHPRAGPGYRRHLCRRGVQSRDLFQAAGGIVEAVGLERAAEADFYRRIGTLGRVFIDIETEALALPS